MAFSCYLTWPALYARSQLYRNEEYGGYRTLPQAGPSSGIRGYIGHPKIWGTSPLTGCHWNPLVSSPSPALGWWASPHP